MKKVVFILSVWLLFAVASFAQNLPSSTIRSIESGNAKELSNGFNSNIELILPNKSGVFSRTQAEFIMTDFFKQNGAQSFTIIHQSKRENASFVIGRFGSTGGLYRFTFLTKNDGGEVLIHQLRIEPEN